MWNTISGNRLIDRKRKEQAHRRHKQALYGIKGLVDNKTPNQYSFLYTRPKALQLKRQRQHNIQINNSILMDKMIRSGSDIRTQYDGIVKQSLNAIYRNKQQKQIDIGNQKLVRRLQSAKSQYSNIVKGEREYYQYKSNLANSRMDPYYDLENQGIYSMQVKNGRPFSAKR